MALRLLHVLASAQVTGDLDFAEDFGWVVVALHFFFVPAGWQVTDDLETAEAFGWVFVAFHFFFVPTGWQGASDDNSADDCGRTLLLVAFGLVEDMTATECHRSHGHHAVATWIAAFLGARVLADGLEAIA